MFNRLRRFLGLVFVREFMCVYSFVQTSDVAQVPEEKAAHSSRAQLTRKPSDNGKNMQTESV